MAADHHLPLGRATPAPGHPRDGAATKRRILDAAEQVVLRDGVGHLTLEAAASRGRAVQGRRALPLPHPGRPGGGHGHPDHRAVRGGHRLLPARARTRPRPTGPGAYARAYVRATLEPVTPGEERLGAALLAAAAAEPELVVPLQEAADGWQARLVDDGLDPDPGHRRSGWPATACGCATCSAWPSPTGDLRARVGAALEQMTRVTRRDPPRPRHRGRRRRPTPRCGSSAPWPSPCSSSGWGRRRSSPCCRSTSATWAAPTPWPDW